MPMPIPNRVWVGVFVLIDIIALLNMPQIVNYIHTFTRRTHIIIKLYLCPHINILIIPNTHMYICMCVCAGE